MSALLRRRLLAAGTATLTVAAAILQAVLAVPARAGTQAVFVVSPTGTGTTCTFAAPCSLTTAQTDVHSLTPGMTGDLVVQLLGGTYTLSQPLTLTSADSGQNGFRVYYEAYPGQRPNLSGGTQITGWSLYDSGKNIYRASVPAGLAARQLYVNGVRGNRASVRGDVLGAVTQTSTGYTVSNSAVSTWANPSNIEMVYTNNGTSWTESRCPIAAISGTTITMAQPCFNTVTTDSQASHVSGTPTAIENNYAFLTQPGQWYLDTSAHYLYYIPRPGEALTGSAQVIVPQVQNLLVAAGTSAAPIKNITVDGLTFQYATWNLPSTSAGFPEFQANVFSLATPGSPTASGEVPGAIAMSNTQNVQFSNNVVQHVGGAGIQFDGGGSQNTIIGNVVTDTSGNGITDGDGNYPLGGQAGVAFPPLQDADTITDNYVHDTGREYHGAVGIFGGYVADTTVAHNTVVDSSYSGISLGWGWGYTHPSSMGNNHIDNNTVSSSMTSSLRDGGGIYVNGPQDANSSPTSTISGNYITDDGQPYGGLYLDGGTTNWHMTNNVVTQIKTNWLSFGAPTPYGNQVDYNYATTSAQFATPGSGCPPSAASHTNCVQNNQTGLTTLPAAANTIVSNAGLESGYTDILDGSALGNLALSASATSSTTYGGAYIPQAAIDSAPGTGFYSATGDTSAWLQLDLGQAYYLSSIQLLTRQGLDQPISLQNLAIEVSNNASGPWTVDCSLGAAQLPYQGSLYCPGLSTQQTWRYVRVAKTDTAPLFVAELRVFGADNLDRDIALGATAYAGSSLAGYPASNADDGNPLTGWSGADNNAAYWEVDLGSPRTIDQVIVQFRQDGCCDQPETRNNLAVQVSNNLDFSLGKTQICSIGPVSLAYRDSLTCTGPASGTYRYVAVVRTVNSYCFLADVYVEGH